MPELDNFDYDDPLAEPPSQPKKRAKKQAAADPELEALAKKAQESDSLHKLIQAQMAAAAAEPSSVRKKFGAWQADKYKHIDNSLWDDFEQEASNLVTRCVVRSSSHTATTAAATIAVQLASTTDGSPATAVQRPAVVRLPAALPAAAAAYVPAADVCELQLCPADDLHLLQSCQPL